jgi:hypothetical protein
MSPPSSGPPPTTPPTRERLSLFNIYLECPAGFDESPPVFEHFRSVPMDFQPR